MPQYLLTPKQELFACEYLIDLNATQAAIRAGYSQNTAATQGSRLLALPQVKARVEKAMHERAKQTKRGAAEVLADIQKLSQLMLENEDYKGALKALELEGKHLGMFSSAPSAKAKINLAEDIKQARKRAGIAQKANSTS